MVPTCTNSILNTTWWPAEVYVVNRFSTLPEGLVLKGIWGHKNEGKRHDWQLRVTHDWSSAYVGGTLPLRLHPPIATAQTLTPNVQDGSICIWDILDSFLVSGRSGDTSSIFISSLCLHIVAYTRLHLGPRIANTLYWHHSICIYSRGKGICTYSHFLET